MRGVRARAVTFDVAALARRLRAWGDTAERPPRALVVAWSGGADSTALLAALLEARSAGGLPRTWPVRALHVDHGLHPASRDWTRHCRGLARRWRVPLAVRRVAVDLAGDESPEAAARSARHAAFAAMLGTDEWLLVAHHAEDQLETMLLRWLRGAGAQGLAAMREQRPCGRGTLVRPLLDVPRAALHAWLAARELPFLVDPSNDDPRFDRNYLRAQVLPALVARWPAAATTAARGARHLDAAQRELDRETARRLDAARDGAGLSLPLLRRLSAPHRAAVLRAWIGEHGRRAPTEARLATMLDLVELREDAQALVAWDGWSVRRHDGRLLLVRETRGGAPNAHWDWPRQRAIELPAGRLALRRDARGDVDLDALPASLLVRHRPAGRTHDAAGRPVDVKGLLQEARVPAWLRDTVPFLHAPSQGTSSGSPLLAVADVWLSATVRASAAALRRGRFVWQPR